MNEADEKRAEAPQGDQPLASQGTGDRTVEYAGGSSGPSSAPRAEFKAQKIRLSKIVEIGGRQYAEIDLDEPSVGGIEAMQNAILAGKSETTAVIDYLVAETGWPPEAVRKMKLTDIEKVTEALRPFAKDMPGN